MYLSISTDPGDAALIEALRAGNEAAFVWVVGTYHASFVRIARGHVPSDAIAEEVAQEAWLGVLNGLDKFEGRSSLQTWMYRILLNIARTRGTREKRCVPVSTLGTRDGPNQHEARMRVRKSPAATRWMGLTSSLWDGIPEDRAEAMEIRSVICKAIDGLAPAQREVIILRDIEHLDSAETCSLLDITPGNQRILLHRARVKVRAALAGYFEPRCRATTSVA